MRLTSAWFWCFFGHGVPSPRSSRGPRCAVCLPLFPFILVSLSFGAHSRVSCCLVLCIRRHFINHLLTGTCLLCQGDDVPLIADFGLSRECEKESYYEAVDSSRKLPLCVCCGFGGFWAAGCGCWLVWAGFFGCLACTSPADVTHCSGRRYTLTLHIDHTTYIYHHFPPHPRD